MSKKPITIYVDSHVAQMALTSRVINIGLGTLGTNTQARRLSLMVTSRHSELLYLKTEISKGLKLVTLNHEVNRAVLNQFSSKSYSYLKCSYLYNF